MAESDERLIAGFEIEEAVLAPETAAVAGERSIRADYAVARNDDRDAVVTVRAPNRALRAWVAQLNRQISVAARFSPAPGKAPLWCGSPDLHGASPEPVILSDVILSLACPELVEGSKERGSGAVSSTTTLR